MIIYKISETETYQVPRPNNGHNSTMICISVKSIKVFVQAYFSRRLRISQSTLEANIKGRETIIKTVRPVPGRGIINDAVSVGKTETSSYR
jgi:hypothetical protein